MSLESLDFFKDPALPKVGQMVKITIKDSNPPYIIEGKVTTPAGMSNIKIDDKDHLVISISFYDKSNFYFLPYTRKWINLKKVIMRGGWIKVIAVHHAINIDLEIIV